MGRFDLSSVVQAEPVEAATPSMSMLNRRASPSTPGNDMFDVPGNRGAPSAVKEYIGDDMLKFRFELVP